MEQQRVIPLDNYFMQDKKSNDIVWGWLQINSTLRVDDKMRFVYCEKSKNALYEKIYNDIGQKISKNTIANTLKLYETTKMIDYTTIKDKYNNNKKVIVLSQNFKYFQYIPLKLLKYLVDTSNTNVIKIYAYLLGRYRWKKEEEKEYIFTLKELCNAIGYSPKTMAQKGRLSNTEKVKNILISLELQGLIEYKEIYVLIDDDGKPKPSKRHVLQNVSLEVKEKPKEKIINKDFTF